MPPRVEPEPEPETPWRPVEQEIAMSLILFIVVVIIVTCLLLYAVHLIQLPPTPLQLWIKPLLMIFITVFAAVAILNKAGIAL